jgi:hypothetical protein
MDKRWTFSLFLGLIATGAVVLFTFRVHNSMATILLVGIVIGTSGLSFVVGFVMGYLVDR